MCRRAGPPVFQSQRPPSCGISSKFLPSSVPQFPCLYEGGHNMNVLRQPGQEGSLGENGHMSMYG